MISQARRIHLQMREMADELVELQALPFVVVAMDANKKGHVLWPDELPSEIVAALPALLQDVLDEAKERPFR